MASRHRPLIAVAVAVAVWLSIAATGAQPEQVFRASVETVVLDVAGVARWRAGAWTERETLHDCRQRHAQAGRAVFHDSVPLSLVLCFDTSSSLGSDGLQRLREAADRLLESLRPEDQVGLVTFAEAVDVRVAPTTRHDDVRAALRTLSPQGPTAWRDALFVAAQLVEPTRSTRSVVLLLTDGSDTSSWMSASQIEDAMGRAGVVIHGIELDTGAGLAPMSTSNLAPPVMSARASPTLRRAVRGKRRPRLVGGVRQGAAAAVPRGAAGTSRPLPRHLHSARAGDRRLAQGHRASQRRTGAMCWRDRATGYRRRSSRDPPAAPPLLAPGRDDLVAAGVGDELPQVLVQVRHRHHPRGAHAALAAEHLDVVVRASRQACRPSPSSGTRTTARPRR